MPKTSSQLRRVDGAPLGTRGGIAVVHTFPADGDYVFRIDLHGNADGFLFGGPAAGEQIDVSINGERKALLDIDPKMAEVTTSLSLHTPPIHVAAGPQRVTAAFIQHFEGPVNDLVAPDRSHAGRHADRRRLRRHHAAAPQGPQHRRPAARHRRVGRRRAGARSSPAGRPTSAKKRPARSQIVRRGWRRRRSGVRRARTTSRALMRFYADGRKERQLRDRHRRRRSRRCSRARSSSSASRRRDPPAINVARRQRPDARSATSSWRRGCRSSCGGPDPTPSC